MLVGDSLVTLVRLGLAGVTRGSLPPRGRGGASVLKGGVARPLHDGNGGGSSVAGCNLRDGRRERCLEGRR